MGRGCKGPRVGGGPIRKGESLADFFRDTEFGQALRADQHDAGVYVPVLARLLQEDAISVVQSSSTFEDLDEHVSSRLVHAPATP